MTGGGSNLKVTVGPKGNVIGFNGGWRTVTDSFEAKVIAPNAAKAQFKELMGGMKVVNATVSLAYYAAPSFTGQEFLYPVYVCGGTAVFGKQRVPLAADHARRDRLRPAAPLPRAAAQAAEAARSPARRRRRTASPSRRASGGASPRARATRPWEAGTSWIGQSGGLAGSHDNAKGFVDEWAAAGWHIDFNWGDANAWESDWRRNDDTWVDNADFVFYTGHANMNGWVLSNPDDGFLDFTEVGAGPATPGDLWGQSDLEWVVVAACGPLQDNVIAAGGGDVLAPLGRRVRRPAHPARATARSRTTTPTKAASSPSTPRAAARSSTRGSAPPGRSSRPRTAPRRRTGRPSGSARCGSARPGVDPVNDHAWDYGSVSADPTSPTWLAAMWTTC